MPLESYRQALSSIHRIVVSRSKEIEIGSARGGGLGIETDMGTRRQRPQMGVDTG